MITVFIDKPFMWHGERISICHNKEANGFWLSSELKGYMGNIKGYNKKFFTWYTYHLGTRVCGTIRFEELKECLLKSP